MRYDERPNFKISLLPDEKQRLDDLIDQYGMKQHEALSRVLRWFMDQDEVVQATILETIPDAVKGDVARIWLQKMTDEPEVIRRIGSKKKAARKKRNSSSD